MEMEGTWEPVQVGGSEEEGFQRQEAFSGRRRPLALPGLHGGREMRSVRHDAFGHRGDDDDRGFRAGTADRGVEVGLQVRGGMGGPGFAEGDVVVAGTVGMGLVGVALSEPFDMAVVTVQAPGGEEPGEQSGRGDENSETVPQNNPH